MFDTPDILNLHFLIGIPTFLRGCQASFAVEDRFACAVAHLAYARTQNSGNGILGVIENIGTISFDIVPFLVALRLRF